VTKLGLSRYCDTGENGCGTYPDTEHHRAIAESGWDNTGRFGDDATQVVPVDLNCQLYRYEEDLSRFCDLLGEAAEADRWRERARGRRELINRSFWDEASGFYWDVDLRSEERLRGTPRCLSSYLPLWAGVADERQAARLVEQLPAFEHDHGLVACEQGWPDETEHNFPTGWAYSHWYVAYGLRRYGYGAEATRIALKWLRLVAARWRESGSFFERYNVADRGGPTPGRYRPQEGFGWTNSVFVALLARIVLGLEFDPFTGERTWEPSLPEGWEERDVGIHLPGYPRPDEPVQGRAEP
jgi:alpha,alpha-trehalase